ncbi:sarcosine oxidase [Histoplasma capsulatum]|uniref:Sarcosine oxidase n=1 Tax=Ajellomyces capsulatus TaxID=5037 RepID=A0A8A1MIW7_AJECA|nr:predicted protein [Histoplasma mississippiense (nom. inval.)]EDN10494.1 predicted protein [Histoplasma mississippiense (nom. inval.)]QSS64603.1 sarcosine oxidase [Histoplasma capsulatum]
MAWIPYPGSSKGVRMTCFARRGGQGGSTVLWRHHLQDRKLQKREKRKESTTEEKWENTAKPSMRAEYEDPMYMRLALEAQEQWRTDPVLKRYFHKTGILFIGIEAPGQAVVRNYEKVLGEGNSPAVLLDPEDAKARFGGIFQDGDWTGVTKCTWNPLAGWGDAANALRAVIQSAVDIGIKYIQATVTKVAFDSNGNCSGITTLEDIQLSADKVILCTGAYTPWILAESDPDRPEIQARNRMVAAASIMCAFSLPEDQVEKFSDCPIVVHPMAECIPQSEPGLIKCTHERSFTHKVFHEASKQDISVPPPRVTQQTFSQDVPQGLKDEAMAARDKLFGNWINNMEPKQYRMCWDSITPNQDWIISPHPHVQNLYIVGGGSFHAWKFLPNVGKYVVQMIDNELGEEFVRRWAWDRSDEGGNCASYIPTRDLKDVPGYS